MYNIIEIIKLMRTITSSSYQIFNLFLLKAT